MDAPNQSEVPKEQMTTEQPSSNVKHDSNNNEYSKIPVSKNEGGDTSYAKGFNKSLNPACTGCPEPGMDK